jgi:imidazolonepropionase-like amidohydrolase
MICITNGKIFTMEGPVYDTGSVLIENGRIKAVGDDIDIPADVEIIDAGGMYVLPGIVDPHCHIGMWEDSMGFEGADGNEMTDPITPALRAVDAINPLDRCFIEAREYGITTVVTGPGSANVIGGQFLAMKTAGECVDDMIIRAPIALKAALGENPKRVYHDQKKSPSTRMATAAELRKALIRAQEYKRKMEQSDPDKRPDRDLDMEIIVRVLDGEIPLKIHAHRADDIQTAVRIAKEFNIQYTLDHCTEGHLIADFLKRENATVIIGPYLTERTKIELRNLTFKAPGILSKAGIKVAMMTDHPVTPTQYLPVCAGIAVREGMEETEAMKMITINAAEAVGLSDRVGSIAPGKDADLAVFDGHPFDTRTHVKWVLIDGEIVKRP